MLSTQLGKSAINKHLGLRMKEHDLAKLNDEQVSQLYELYQEIQNPSADNQSSDKNIDINNLKPNS